MQKKILLVDDDPFIIDFVSDILIQNGYEVIAGYNGEVGIKIMTHEMPDLVIMDWEMPVLNGIETLKKIKETQEISDIPVIMITGRMTTVEDLKASLDAGAVDFIRKPIEPVELIARTRSMLLLSGYYKETLKKKEWELALLSKTNHQNEKIFNELFEIVNKFYANENGGGNNKLDELQNRMNSVKSNFRNNSWEQFEAYFSNVHPHFSTNLLAEYPNITSEELRLCHFLKMNMSSKDIAAATNKEMHSVDIARYRLRKKLGIDRSVKLNVFLARF